MPYKDGRLTRSEKAFAQHYASTGDAVYAAEKAGYGSPGPRASELLRKPPVVAEAERQRREKLEMLDGLALHVVEETLRSSKARDADKLTAVKIVLGERRAAQEGSGAGKEGHEFTWDELQNAIDAAMSNLRVIPGEASPIVEPNEAVEAMMD